MAPKQYVYEVDAGNYITFVSDDWLEFACENDSPQLNREAVVGRPLWDFIEGIDTRQLYRELMERVRANAQSASLRFRCDAPGKCRHLRLAISALPDGALRFTSVIEDESDRPELRLLDPRFPRSEEIIVICSVCKCLRTGEETWTALETAVDELGLMETETQPQLSHGLCPACRDAALADLM